MLASSIAGIGLRAAGESAGPEYVYFGTYTGAKSKGIYVARFDPATGNLSTPELAAETKNPTFLALGRGEEVLYAVNEVSDRGGGHSGAISAFRVDGKTGKLTFLNERPSGGAGPCHLAADPAGECVLVANYGSGSVAVLPVEPDGRLRAPSACIQHHGSSVNPQRQEGPHAHFITWDPAKRLIFTCDLGLDKVLAYKLERPQLSLSANDPPFFSSKPGSGPRHLAFHPNGRYAYIINEMASTITVCTYEPLRGQLKEIETVNALPEGFSGSNTSAEIEVHPSGRFLYASNRGNDSIVVFSIDPTQGTLKWLQHQSSQGKTPRHIALDPAGKWLLAENQDSDNVAVFRLDTETGRLSSTGSNQKLGAPVCAVFVQRR